MKAARLRSTQPPFHREQNGAPMLLSRRHPGPPPPTGRHVITSEEATFLVFGSAGDGRRRSPPGARSSRSGAARPARACETSDYHPGLEHRHRCGVGSVVSCGGVQPSHLGNACGLLTHGGDGFGHPIGSGNRQQGTVHGIALLPARESVLRSRHHDFTQDLYQSHVSVSGSP